MRKLKKEKSLKKIKRIMEKKTYLGDSVYAEFDGYGIILTTENDGLGASNVIVLEPEVVEAFERFVGDLRKNSES